MYRGLSVIGEKWVYGYLFVAEDIKGNKQYQILQPDYFIGLHKMHVVNEDTIEEYARYDDKSGKRIYEGDRVSFKRPKVSIAVEIPPEREYGTVEIWQGMACVKVDNIEKNERTPYLPLFYAQDIEIMETHGEEPERKTML